MMARMRERVGCGSRMGRRFCIPQSTVHSLQSTCHAGFTLLEVLVSMSILMVIVLMMATLFGQSTTAWDQGINQAKLGLKGRAVMSMMQNELSQAVCDDELPCDFQPKSFTIYILADEPESSGDPRLVKEVTYSAPGSVLRRTEKTVVRGADPYGVYGATASAPLLTNVVSFSVNWPGGNSTTNLPAWVELNLVLTETMGETAGIKVSSGGRDGPASTNDNINTW